MVRKWTNTFAICVAMFTILNWVTPRTVWNLEQVLQISPIHGYARSVVWIKPTSTRLEYSLIGMKGANTLSELNKID